MHAQRTELVGERYYPNGEHTLMSKLACIHIYACMGKGFINKQGRLETEETCGGNMFLFRLTSVTHTITIKNICSSFDEVYNTYRFTRLFDYGKIIP